MPSNYSCRETRPDDQPKAPLWFPPCPGRSLPGRVPLGGQAMDPQGSPRNSINTPSSCLSTEVTWIWGAWDPQFPPAGTAQRKTTSRGLIRETSGLYAPPPGRFPQPRAFALSWARTVTITLARSRQVMSYLPFPIKDFQGEKKNWISQCTRGSEDMYWFRTFTMLGKVHL